MQELLNKQILDIQISFLECYLKFITKDSEIIYATEADCCSETWFSEILNIDFLINHTVSAVADLRYNMPKPVLPDPHCRQESDTFYGIRINTEAGTSTIVFRNSSNGYYGGSYELMTNEVPKEYVFTSICHLSDWTAYQPTRESYLHTLKLRMFL